MIINFTAGYIVVEFILEDKKGGMARLIQSGIKCTMSNEYLKEGNVWYIVDSPRNREKLQILKDHYSIKNLKQLNLFDQYKNEP